MSSAGSIAAMIESLKYNRGLLRRRGRTTKEARLEKRKSYLKATKGKLHFDKDINNPEAQALLRKFHREVVIIRVVSWTVAIIVLTIGTMLVLKLYSYW